MPGQLDDRIAATNRRVSRKCDLGTEEAYQRAGGAELLAIDAGPDAAEDLHGTGHLEIGEQGPQWLADRM